MLSKLNKFFSSVKLAIFLFIAIAVFSMVGTFINQGDTISQYKTMFGVKVFSVLYWLGFLNIYDSWYFIGLAILLIINLIAASANTLPRTLKAVFGPYPSFKEMADKKNPKAVYEGFESQNNAEKITKTLNSRFGAPLAFRDGGKPQEKELYYSKNSIFRFSPYIAHLSVIIIIIGVLLNVKYGFRSYTNIKVGEKTDVSYLTKNQQPLKLPFTIRLDKYETKYYPDGIPKSYISKISIIKNHVRVATKNIKVNHPFTYDGITIYQASYGHYKPTKVIVGLLVLNLKNRKFRKVIYAGVGQPYDAGIGNIKFRFIAHKKPKKGEIPFFIKLNNKRIINFHVLPYKNKSAPLVFAKYDNIVFLYNGVKQVKSYYYSGVEITKNSYTSIVWVGSIILIMALFFSFFFNHREIWVSLTNSKDGKKIRVEILAVPKKKFESFYKNFNKKMAAIKKELQ
ncbi:MAG: cytochrome c biogenesis protein ResB [bacterium]